MIVRTDKTYEISSAFPNSNPYENEPDNLIVDETTEEGQSLAAKVMQYAPYMDLVIEDGKLVDVTPTERPPEPTPEPSLEEQVTQLKSDNLTLMEAIAELYEMMVGGGTTA